MNFIRFEDVSFSYQTRSGALEALKELSFEIKEGSSVSIIGPNGCGKSTVAKLMNGLLKPSAGKVFVNGLDTSDERNLMAIRRSAGLVFQNPDNQAVGDTVEEDVAFGPENLGLSEAEIRQRVDEALALLEITELRDKTLSKLSGGQKQRVAIASVLAMGCKCIILDEATSMLDQEGRKTFLSNLEQLRQKTSLTVISITHHMDECINSDQIIVMDKGRLHMTGSPKEIFSDIGALRRLRLSVPYVTEISAKAGFDSILSTEDLIRTIKERRDAL